MSRVIIFACFLIMAAFVFGQKISLYEASIDYTPTTKKITVDLENVDLSNDEERNIEGSFIILLKQLLFHLNCCNQSYNLLDMFDRKSEIILDLTLDYMGEDKAKYTREGFGSWLPAIYLEQNKSFESPHIVDLMNKVELERIRLRNE